MASSVLTHPLIRGKLAHLPQSDGRLPLPLNSVVDRYAGRNRLDSGDKNARTRC